MSSTVTVVASKAALAEEAAQAVAAAAEEAVGRTGRFMLALSGGSTPHRLYARLASPPFRSRIEWARVHVFWGDERCVPPDHPDSNYRLTSESLLSKVPIPPQQIHRMRGEDPDLDRAAEAYTRQLTRAFTLAPGESPRFDLILLGLGADGHTASLFPGSPALDETTRPVVAVHAGPAPAPRLTLTLPVLNAAARVIFLVSGEEKAEVLRMVLQGGASPDRPASLIRPADGPLWLVDRAAAASLGHMLGEDR
jgi:6-phosphogluconolactonase